VTSGTNGLVSTDAWSYTSRINCKATSVIGYSVKGRPIVAYYYGSGSTTILFTGNIHGNERSAYQTMLGWAANLDTNAYKIPAGKQVVIVPTANPDGYATNSRYNANNVNVDRNFPTSDWSSDIDTGSGTMAGGGGSAPSSEPETRALINLTSQLNPRVEVSFHSQGRLVGANDYADSRSIADAYASLVGYSTMFGSSAEDLMGYSFTGEYEDWIGERLGKPAILIELPSSSGNYFSSQQSALWRMVNL
jgi:protein MpaA